MQYVSSWNFILTSTRKVVEENCRNDKGLILIMLMEDWHPIKNVYEESEYHCMANSAEEVIGQRCKNGGDWKKRYKE